MSTPHVIIIGAGAAGLMSAVELAKSGRQVTLLEARHRIGGRMHTITQGFDKPAEAGAEFIHGDLPITKNLLDDAGITYREAEGGFYEREADGIKPMEGATEENNFVKRKLDSLEQDVTVAQFIQQYLNGDEHAETREELQSFVEGFDSGDINKASAFTLRDELSARQEPQYRIDGGYIKLVELLTQQCSEAGVEIVLNTQVKSINWQRGDVAIHTASGKIYKGGTALITAPLAVLYEDIDFKPAIPQHIAAAKEIGYGGVIKVLLQFDKAFWKEGKFGAEDLSFLFSETKIPTFWTQYPNDSNVLVGWLCGPKAVAKKGRTNEEILQEAIQSISKTFEIALPDLQQMLSHHQIHNWTADPFTKGAYAYSTVDGTKQREILRMPVANTIFFAGEGLYIGEHYGTVEAALESGLHAVQQILTAGNTKG